VPCSALSGSQRCGVASAAALDGLLASAYLRARAIRTRVCVIVHDSRLVGHVACRRRWGDVSGRGRTPPQWLPTPRWTIALTGWRETFSFNAGLAGNASDSSGDKLHELHRRRRRCRGAALAPSHLGNQRAFHGRCARPRYFPFVHGMRARRLSGQSAALSSADHTFDCGTDRCRTRALWTCEELVHGKRRGCHQVDCR